MGSQKCGKQHETGKQKPAAPNFHPAAPPPALNHGGGVLLQRAFSKGSLDALEQMAADLPESDWKAFRKLREIALERFCERILEEISRVTSDAKRTSHARYLAAYEIIQERDDQIARAFNNPRRSGAVLQLATMMSLDLITQQELQSFTPRTQSVVEALRQPMRKARASKSA